MSKGLNQFNHDLFPKLAALNDGNIVISPFSLHTALSMTLIGTPTKSDTHKQLSRALFGEDQFDNEAAKTRQISGSFLWRQLSINNYHVKKYVKESQFLLFSRQKVYKNAKFVYITEIL